MEVAGDVPYEKCEVGREGMTTDDLRPGTLEFIWGKASGGFTVRAGMPRHAELHRNTF
jgi:hypothetical protein